MKTKRNLTSALLGITLIIFAIFISVPEEPPTLEEIEQIEIETGIVQPLTPTIQYEIERLETGKGLRPGTMRVIKNGK